MIHIVSQKLILLLPTNWPRISSFFIGACFHPQSGGNRDSKWPAGMNELLFCMSECLYWFPCLLSSQCRDSLQPLLWPWKETGGWRIGITSKSKHAASCFFPHHIPVFSWCCYTTTQCFRFFFLPWYFWQHIFISQGVMIGCDSCQCQRHNISLMSSFISPSWAFLHFELQIGFDKDRLRGAEITVRSVPLFCSLPSYL